MCWVTVVSRWQSLQREFTAPCFDVLSFATSVEVSRLRQLRITCVCTLQQNSSMLENSTMKESSSGFFDRKYRS